MSDTLLVAVVDCFDHLSEVESRKLLVKSASLGHNIEQLTPLSQFNCDEADHGVLFGGSLLVHLLIVVVEGNDIGVLL